MTSPNQLKISRESFCIEDLHTQLYLRHLPPVPMLVHWTGGVMERAMVEVTVDGRPYWADRITGSLYERDTGRCLTSDSLLLVVETPTPMEA